MPADMADEKAPAVIDPAKLVEELDKLLGEPDDHIPIPALPRGARFMWGWRSDAANNPTMFVAGTPWPFAEGMTIVALFKDENEVRAYALGNRPATAGERLAPTRYSIDKRGPNIFSESMPIEIFKGELAKEFAVLEHRTIEPEDVPQFVMSLLDDDDDETDDPTPPPQPNGEAKTPAPAAE